MTPFVPTRAEGLRRLAAFLPAAGRSYAENRNTDGGPEARDNVSVLSPYLRYRLLTEEEVIAAALAQHGPEAAGKFVQEVGWRTYWKGWLELRPAVWRRFGEERDAVRGSGLMRAVAQAEAGTTGIEGFDDWARELVQHGYLHNHARMWFASIWVFHAPVALGARRGFLSASSRGCRPRIQHAVVAVGGGPADAGQDLPGDRGQHRALHGGSLPPRGSGVPGGGADRAGPSGRPHAAASARGCGWAGTAAADAGGPLRGPDVAGPRTARRRHPRRAPGARRARLAVGGTRRRASSTALWRMRRSEWRRRWAAASRWSTCWRRTRWSKPHALRGAEAVVTADAPVGPVADTIDALGETLASAGLKLVRMRREWDERLWPFATKGFFAFRQHLPAERPGRAG